MEAIEAARIAVNNLSPTEDQHTADDIGSSKSSPPFDDSLPPFDDNQSVASARTSSSIGKDLKEQQYWDREDDDDDDEEEEEEEEEDDDDDDNEKQTETSR